MYTTIIDNTSALQEHSAKVVQNRVSHGTRATTTSVLVRNSAREHGDGFTVSHTQSIESPDVRKLAELAQLGITDEEEREWSEQIESIVAWFGQLQEVDVEGVEPAMRGGVVGEGRDEEGSRLRRDVGRVYEARCVVIVCGCDCMWL